MKLASPLALAALVTAASCSTPRELTVEENRAAAAEHAARADELERRYDPAATVVEVAEGPAGSPVVETFNPTDRFREAAERNRREAAAHEKVAARLAALEDAACTALPANVHASCPVIGTLVAMQPVRGGARVKFKDPAMRDALVARIRCHTAYARQHPSEEGLAECPLYLDGLAVDVDGDWTLLRTNVPAAEAALVDLLRGHLPAKP